MDGKAYLIHSFNRRHDVASFYDDSQGAMKRFLVETELDRSWRESDDEEIDVQSSILRIKALPLIAGNVRAGYQPARKKHVAGATMASQPGQGMRS